MEENLASLAHSLDRCAKMGVRFSNVDPEIGTYFATKNRGSAAIFTDVHDLSVKVTNAGYLGASDNVQLLRKQRGDID